MREVWYCKAGRITSYVLVGEHYEARAVSAVLEGIDLGSIAQHLDAPTTSAAIRAYRETLK